MLQSLYLRGSSALYPFDGRLGGPQSRFGRGGEEHESVILSGKELWLFT